MNQEHILSLVSDYVLDLVPATERQHIEDHAAGCETCRRALQREKQLALMVGHTLHLAAQPGTGRLQALMPSPRPSPPHPSKQPQRKVISPPASRVTAWTLQLAPVTVVLLLLFGSLWIYLNSPSDPWGNPVPGYIMVTEAAATATATVTATSSATSPPTSSPIATIGGDKTTLGQTAESNITYNGRPETAKTPIAQIVLGNGTN